MSRGVPALQLPLGIMEDWVWKEDDILILILN
jgi:hypothetical protein